MGRCAAPARAQVVIAGMVVLQTFMVIVNTAGVPARAAFPEGAGEMKLFPHKMAATLLSGVLRVIPTPDLSWD
jgi:hypothetical protein